MSEAAKTYNTEINVFNYSSLPRLATLPFGKIDHTPDFPTSS